MPPPTQGSEGDEGGDDFSLLRSSGAAASDPLPEGISSFAALAAPFRGNKIRADGFRGRGRPSLKTPGEWDPRAPKGGSGAARESGRAT